MHWRIGEDDEDRIHGGNPGTGMNFQSPWKTPRKSLQEGSGLLEVVQFGPQCIGRGKADGRAGSFGFGLMTQKKEMKIDGVGRI